MSIPVEPEALGEALDSYGTRAFLLTAGADGRPHVAHVTLAWDGSGFSCGIGRTGSANVAACDLVTLLWPPHEPDGYSMIVDATASAADGVATIAPSGGVLHRPAPAAPDAESSCGSDCAPLGTA